MTPSEPQTQRFPVRIKVYGGSLSLLPPGSAWRVERVTEHVAPTGLIGEVLPEWTIFDLAPAIERDAQGIPLIDVELLRDTPEDRALLERIGHSFANWAPGHSKEWAASLIGAIKAERARPERMRAIYRRLASESSPVEEGP